MKMGSETNNCNSGDYYASQDISTNISPSSTNHYYHNTTENDSTKNINHWMNSDHNQGMNQSRQNQDMNSHEQIIRNNSENKNKTYIQNSNQPPNQQSSQWNFTGNSYQRFYNDSQYGIVLASNSSSQQNESLMPSSSSSISQAIIENHSQLAHQMQSQHFKRAYYQGKTNNKDICGDDKHKEDGDPWNVEAQAAFLGPNLWDKTLPYDTDLKVHQYADLDEFLSENGIPVDGLPSSHLGHSTNIGGGGTNNRNDNLGHGLSLGLGPVTKRERSPSPSDCMSPDTINNPPSPADSTFSMSSTRDFDPRTRAFSDEELKPSPMIKKSRKQFVPDEMKDDKYWARRRKNNMAAKRSRDARRMKENQIALRAGFLEKENMNLHREVEQLKQENMELRSRLSKYQEV
ncbi:hepatic leukemia factor isoform X4 [Chironomus tepperi]|uniref:hepatic leukemia factor isoform X4 n=1 Tax=Chironomus tepperi TaxID=113505 RepID=UPI00391F15C1